jgi:hypothetical protein
MSLGGVMSKVIPGIKLICDTGQHKEKDDPSLPYKLHVVFSAHERTFGLVHGEIEEIIVRAKTMQVMMEFLEANAFENRRRFISLTLTGPEGIVKEVEH